jgi:hypothetical protein
LGLGVRADSWINWVFALMLGLTMLTVANRARSALAEVKE